MLALRTPTLDVEMQITCRHCRKTVEFSGERPAFCHHCGQPQTDSADDATLPFHPVDGSEAKSEANRITAATASAAQQVGNYRLLRVLGEGGMGAVWEAEQTGTGRRVALKLLSPRLQPTPDNVERFLREGKSAAAISHPRSTFVFEAGDENGQPFIVMELMPGRTLADELEKSGRFEVERAVDCILDVIEGLEAAHSLGVIHRDLKPSNCFIDSDGRVKVGDFGLSKSLVSDATLTRTGAFLGTPQFAAPEQVRGGTVDQRTDVYAVGATLFCLLAGRGPFVGDAAAVIAQIVADPAPPLNTLRPDVRPTLSRIIGRALERDPARRYQDLAALRRALVPFATGGVSIADVGRRLAAYMLDELLVGVVTTVIVAIALGVLVARSPALVAHQPDPSSHADNTVTRSLMQATLLQLLVVSLRIVYFAVAEAKWGRAVGKQLMGLRVIGADGDRPGFVRALVRSLFIPGALYLGVLPSFFMVGLQPAADKMPSFGTVVSSVATGSLPFVFVLLCLTTMRARNGYRGLHEFASGTRVVRLRAALAPRTQRVPSVPRVAAASEIRHFGPFRVVGEIGLSDKRKVLEARDELLSRAVWIYVGEDGLDIFPRLREIARPMRPRWLQGGESPEGRWDAFEVVTGSPLTTVALESPAMSWPQSRFWLLDLSEELLAAAADGTLADSVSLDQIWLDGNGRLKLLPAPVSSGPGRQVGRPQTGTAVERAVGLLREGVRLGTRGQLLPAHVREVTEELERRPSDEETLVWAVDRLRESVAKPASLNWDERLGVLAISFGIELSIYAAVAAFLSAFLAVRGWPVERLAVVIPLLALIPGFIGCAFQGGPAFWLTGVDVLGADGRRAKRWRCALRSFLAWAPVMILYGFFALILIMTGRPNGDAGQALQNQLDRNDPAALIAVVGVCSGTLLFLLFCIGALYAVLSPRRGVQDWLAGTWLAPH